MTPSRSAERLSIGRDSSSEGMRVVAEETPIAFTYGRDTYAVMMATPSDLEDFAVGFSMTEGVIAKPDEITELEIVKHPKGVELRMALIDDRDVALLNRRRKLAGPVGCGLCGVESLEAAITPVRHVKSEAKVDRATIFNALARTISTRCARMSAATMRSTSFAARWHATAATQAAGSSFSPAAFP